MESNKKLLYPLLAFSIIIIIIYFVWGICFSKSKLRVSLERVGNMDVNSTAEYLKNNKWKTYKDEQIKGILLSMGILSKVDPKNLFSDKNVPNDQKDKFNAGITNISNLLVSFQNFLFNKNNALEKIFDSQENDHKYVKEVLSDLGEFKAPTSESETHKDALNNSDLFKNEDEDVLKFVNDTKINFAREYSMLEYTFLRLVDLFLNNRFLLSPTTN